MHEEQKLKESWFFLSEMHDRTDDPSAFVHCLSAFLSAARSVAQYALDEAKAKNGGQAWYDSQVAKAAHPNIAFFKDQRDLNIHAKPVSPRRVFNVEATTTLYLSGSADYNLTFRDDEGNVIEFESPPPEATTDRPSVPDQQEVDVRYEFHARPDEDVLDLCQTYLKELESMVADGQARGFLTR